MDVVLAYGSPLIINGVPIGRALDNRYLSRLSNLETLIKWVTVGALAIAGIAVVALELLTHAGVVADVFFGLAILVAAMLGLKWIQRLIPRRVHPQRVESIVDSAIEAQAIKLAELRGIERGATGRDVGTPRTQRVRESATLGIEPDSPNVAPTGHTAELRGLLDGAIRSIERDEQYRYDEESPVGPPVRRNSFAAHFPDLGSRVDAWNEALYACEEPRRDLGHRILLEADKRGLLDGTYWKDAVLNVLVQATLSSNEVGSHPQQTAQIRWWRAKHPFFGWTLEANDRRVASAEDETVIDEAERAITALLTDIRSWPETAAVADANRRYVLSNEKRALLADLRSRRAAETIFVAAYGCEICRLNRPDPAPTALAAPSL